MALAALMLWAQSARDTYRDAYRAWREIDPSLERDAETGGESLGARADRVAAGAVKYSTERGAFLDRFAQANALQLKWLATPTEAAPVIKAGGDYIAAQTAAVRRGIDAFASDPAPGIQQVRSMLERENIALGALSAAVTAREKAAGEAEAAIAAVEAARVKALDLDRAFALEVKKEGEQTGAETQAWAEYYRKLSDGARSISTGAPVSSIATRPLDPAPRPTPSITALPLPRYTGDWIFAPNGMYHGSQPEFVDLVVRENNGRCEGRMVARFILPPGSNGDPVLRFEFGGEFKSTVRQSFPLETSDGATGTIDLIPGTAFNLIEINIQIAAKPGKVRQANVVLIKK
jgi:hypothetical protein